MFINETGVIGVLLSNASNYVFGSLFLALLAMVLLFVALMTAFRMPIEGSLILLLPLLTILAVYDAAFLPIVGFVLFVLGLIIVRSILR